MPELLTRLQSALSDRYRLEREIGAGGMATVYVAHDIRHDRRVALKVLRPELAAVIGAERFLAEIHPHRQPAALAHPPAVRFGRGRLLSLLRDAVRAGRDPARTGSPGRSSPVADAIRIATEIASALDYAHRSGGPPRHQAGEHPASRRAGACGRFRDRAGRQQASGAWMTETGMSLGTLHKG